jgi:hypothetical protein
MGNKATVLSEYLRILIREVFLHGKRIAELGQMTLKGLFEFLDAIQDEELSQFSFFFYTALVLNRILRYAAKF